MYISIGKGQGYFFCVSVLLFSEVRIDVVITCGRRPGENNKGWGHDRMCQFQARDKGDIWE